MGAKIQNASPTNHNRKFSNSSLIFSPMVHTKLRLGLFEILKIEIFFSLTWDQIGAKNSKRYSSYKIHPKLF